jgi:WD40 repeat protein
VLLDLRFIEGKFRQEMGHDLLQDFVLAVQAKAPEAARTGKWGEGQKKIQDVHRYIAQNFKRLQLEAASAFQIAGNLSDSSTLSKLAVHHWQEGWVRQPWLRWMNKPSELDPLILIMDGHTAPVTKVRFSTDGLRIISSSEDCTIRLWDAFSGEVMQCIEGHLLPVLTVIFIPGYGGGELRGKVSSSDWSVITGSRDKTMKLFDLASGMEMRSFKGHIGRVLCCTVTTVTDYDPVTHDPLKRTLVATGSWDRSIKVWDLDTTEILHDLRGPEHSNTSPNSHGHQNTVRDLSFSPDGSVLASGSDDETVRLWNMMNGCEIKAFIGHDNAVTSVDYSRNGALVLSASLDATLKMWDTSEEGGGPRSFFDKPSNSWMKIRKEIATFVGNQEGVKEGRLSSDMKFVVSGGMDGTVRVYLAEVNSAMFENRKRGIAVDIPPLITLFGHAGGVRTVCISPDSWRVVSSGDDGTLRIWDLGGTGTPVKQGHPLTCGGVSYGPYGEVVATCGFDGTLKLWDGRLGLYIKDITKRDVQFIRCALSPDAIRVATANEDGVIRVYDVERGEPVITQRQAFVRSRAVTYSHGKGFNIATGSDDGWVKFWAADSGELKCQLDAHVKPQEEGKQRKYSAVLDIAYHPSNIRLATCSDDNTIKYWVRTFASSLVSALNVGVKEAEMPNEEELMEAKRKRLMEAKRREALEAMTQEQRLARQRRKEKELKKKIADKQMAHAEGQEINDESDDDSDDSLLADDDIMLIEKAVYEDDDDEIEVQNIAADPQKWELCSTLYGHKAAVTSVMFSFEGTRCFSASEDATIRAWTADIEASEGGPLPTDDEIEDLPAEAQEAAKKLKKEAAKKKEVHLHVV